jgi:diguanylate cyclase (GGDEF)-like protein
MRNHNTLKELYSCHRFPINTYVCPSVKQIMVIKDINSVKRTASRTLADILGDHVEVPALVRRSGAANGKVVVVLPDRLAQEDMKALNDTAHLVISVEDDLIRKIAELHDENVRLQSLALIDDLTGLYNSRHFLIQLETERARTRRTGLPCCLLMIDLDNFKLLNDSLGHLEGNRLLVEVGKAICDHVRPTDIACRYGGDEFAIIMPATDLLDAVKIAERLRKAVSVIPKPVDLNITASIGAAECGPSSSGGVNEFIYLADTAMYEAKRLGKNQVSTHGQVEKATARSGHVSPAEREALFAKYETTEHRGDSDETEW